MVNPIHWAAPANAQQKAENDEFWRQTNAAKAAFASLTPKRAAELDFEIARYDAIMEESLKKASGIPKGSVMESRYKTNPLIGRDYQIWDANAPEDFKKAGALRAIALNERYAQKNNTWDVVKSIATIAGAAYGLSTFAGAVNSGTLSWATINPFSSPASAATSGAKAAVGAAGGGGAAGGTAATVASGATTAAGVVKKGIDLLTSVGDILNPIMGGGAASAVSTWFEAEQARLKAQADANEYKSQADTYAYNATQANFNQKASLANYVYEQQRLISEQTRMKRENEKMIGAQKATYGASGVGYSGSAEDVLMDSAAQGELNIALAGFESRQRQRNYLIQAEEFKRAEDFAKKNAVISLQNAENSIKAGNEISDWLKTKAAIEGISSVPDIIKGAGAAVDLWNKL